MINIGLDLDGVLVCASHDLKRKPYDGSLHTFFKKHGAVITIEFHGRLIKHYINPGTIELLKFLDRFDFIKVSFFSSGHPDRNTPLVEKLLKRTFGEEHYNEVKNRFRVIQNFEIPNKNVTRLIKKGGLIENTILIDDSPSNIITPTQENPDIKCQRQNFFYCPPTNEEHFTKLKSKEGYALDGTKPLRCTLLQDASELSALHKLKVVCGKDIYILKTDENYEILFHNNATILEERLPVLATDEKLLGALNQHFKDNEITSSEVINDAYLKALVLDFVNEKNGKTTKISRHVNRLCYISGVLFFLILGYKTENLPVAETLHDFQWGGGKETPELLTVRASQFEKFYHAGLKLLRTMNEDYKFISPHTSDLKTVPLEEAHD